MHQVLRFWLDRGVDGFRADVIHCIGKDPALPDDPAAVAGLPHCILNDVPTTHRRLRAIRALLDGYPGDRVMVGEVYLLSTETVATYYGAGDELHLAFNFPPLLAPWRARPWSDASRRPRRALGPRRGLAHLGAVQPRQPPPPLPLRPRRRPVGEDPATTARRSEARARAAAVLLLTLRGSPFLYQGEELGLLDARGPRRTPGRPRGSRRLPGADPVERAPRSRLGHSPGIPAMAALPT